MSSEKNRSVAYPQMKTKSSIPAGIVGHFLRFSSFHYDCMFSLALRLSLSV